MKLTTESRNGTCDVTFFSLEKGVSVELSVTPEFGRDETFMRTLNIPSRGKRFVTYIGWKHLTSPQYYNNDSKMNPNPAVVHFVELGIGMKSGGKLKQITPRLRKHSRIHLFIME